MVASNSKPALLPGETAHQINERLRLQRESIDRLYWTLAGDFPACVSVMKTSKSGREGLEPLQNLDGTWHEVASLPMHPSDSWTSGNTTGSMTTSATREASMLRTESPMMRIGLMQER